MKIKISEATPLQLDYLVATCEGKAGDCEVHSGNIWYGRVTSGFVQYRPSTNWAQGGPIIEREKIRLDTSWNCEDGQWSARIDGVGGWWQGETPLIAAMRCYVASKLGDEIDVPEGLE